MIKNGLIRYSNWATTIEYYEALLYFVKDEKTRCVLDVSISAFSGLLKLANAFYSTVVELVTGLTLAVVELVVNTAINLAKLRSELIA